MLFSFIGNTFIFDAWIYQENERVDECVCVEERVHGVTFSFFISIVLKFAMTSFKISNNILYDTIWIYFSFILMQFKEQVTTYYYVVWYERVYVYLIPTQTPY